MYASLELMITYGQDSIICEISRKWSKYVVLWPLRILKITKVFPSVPKSIMQHYKVLNQIILEIEIVWKKMTVLFWINNFYIFYWPTMPWNIRHDLWNNLYVIKQDIGLMLKVYLLRKWKVQSLMLTWIPYQIFTASQLRMDGMWGVSGSLRLL